MGEFTKLAHHVKSKDDFIEFVGFLIRNLKANPADWENKTLDSYLEGIQSWTEDMDGYYINNNLPIPENINWKVFADILIAATIYE
jgi:hypothetical protein